MIGQEQDRIRQNMAQLDRTTDLYKRYVKKFGDQEDEVERLRGEIQKLDEEEAKSPQIARGLPGRPGVGVVAGSDGLLRVRLRPASASALRSLP